jgi:hypothetical protein
MSHPSLTLVPMLRWLVERLLEAFDVLPSRRWRRRVARALLALLVLFPSTVLAVERERLEAQLRPVVAAVLDAVRRGHASPQH